MSEEYKNLISEIVKKQMDLLGPDMALRKAKNVPGLSLNDDGSVLELQGESHAMLQKLVDEYISLSGEIVKNILGPVFLKYPEIKINLK